MSEETKPKNILSWMRDVFNLSTPTVFTPNFPHDVMKGPPDPDWQRDNSAFGATVNPQGDPNTDQGQPKTVIIHQDRIGSSGTISFTGYPAEDYLHILKGKHKANVYDHMRRSDPQVKMCLNAVKNPIRSATWEIDPVNSSDDEEIKIANFVQYVLMNNMDRPFEKFISEALTMCDFGHAVFEITNKLVKGDPKFGDFVGIKDLGWRSPKTIERWNLDKQTDRLESILQLAWGDTARFVTIPGEFLIVFSVEREGSNYEGISMLRPCYGNWFRKDLYQKLNSIGIEKFAIPTPVATVPSGQQNSDQYNSLLTVLEDYVTHQKQYITIPTGWTIDLKSNAYDPSKVETSIDNEDTRMVRAFMANFLNLGMSSSGGNRALGDSLKAFFLSGIEYLAKEVCSEINLTLIPMIVKQNFGPRAKYPSLKASGISDQAGVEFGNLMKALADAQIIIPDDPLEDHVRKRMGLPKMSEVGQRKVQAKGASGLGTQDIAVDTQDQSDDAAVNTLAERIKLAELKRRKLIKKKDKSS